MGIMDLVYLFEENLTITLILC